VGKSKLGLPPIKPTGSIKSRNFYHELCKRHDIKWENPNRKKSEQRSLKRCNSSPKLRQTHFDKHPEFYVKQYRKLIDFNQTAPFQIGQVDAILRGTFSTHQHIASTQDKGVNACGFCHTLNLPTRSPSQRSD
jgi:superoxide dismutase